MEQIEIPPVSSHVPTVSEQASEAAQGERDGFPPTDEQEFYAAQEEAFAALRAYHSSRARTKR